MKFISKITIVAVLLFSFSTVTSAQKTLKEGSVIYELTDVQDESPQAQMMKGTRMSLYFNKKNQKLEMNMMGGLMEITTFMNMENEETTMLTNMMGNKSMVKMTKEDADKQKAKNPKMDFAVSFDKKDKKEIVGYNCYKAILTDTSGNVINVYVTDEIKTKLKFFKEMFPGLEAFPLEYSISNAGMEIVFSAQEFKTKVDSDAFDIPTEGYTEMTMEEFEQQMGGMGGLGF